MRHILVPYDFNDTARHALEYAVRLVGDLQGRITLLHVPYTEKVTEALMGLDAVQYLSKTLNRDPDSVPTPSFPLDKLIEAARMKLEQAIDPSWRETVPFETAVVDGRPDKMIVDYARDHDIDLIIMGTHGRGPVAHLFLGSVAENVVRTAHCPVLTVRQPAQG